MQNKQQSCTEPSTLGNDLRITGPAYVESNGHLIKPLNKQSSVQ